MVIGAEALTEIIEQERIITHFQPIISLKNPLLRGFEALSRSIDGRGAIIPPDILFSAAGSQGKAVEMDRLCRGKAIEQYHRLQALAPGCRPPLLFLNFDPSLLDRGVAGSGFLQKQIARLNIQSSQIVIEIVENKVEDVAALGRFVHDYRSRGFIMALDDVGAGYSNFDRITIIKPDVIKIDRAIIRDIHRDYYKQEIFKALVRLARKIGTLVLAEGIETVEECLCVLSCDVDLLQGYFFARPAAPEEISLAELNSVAASVADRYRADKIEKIRRISEQYRTYRQIIGEMKATLADNPPARFEGILKYMIQELPLIEAVYVLNDKGIMITATILGECRWAKGNMIFQKAGQGDDLSLKEYFYLPLFTGLQHYVTRSYVSWATGNLTRTLSSPFRGLSGEGYLLCLDVLADSHFELPPKGEGPSHEGRASG